VKNPKIWPILLYYTYSGNHGIGENRDLEVPRMQPSPNLED